MTSAPERSAATVSCLLLPGFDLFDLAALTEISALANALQNGERIAWETVCFDDKRVTSSLGIAVDTARRLSDLSNTDMLVVLAGRTRAKIENAALAAGLARLSASTPLLVAVGPACRVLIRAGILRGKRTAPHWDTLAALRLLDPRLRATGQLFIRDQNVITCCGGTATIDFALSWIHGRLGGAVAQAVAEKLNHVVRLGDEEQPVRAGTWREKMPAVLRTAISAMRASASPRWSMSELADEIGVTSRQLQRLFQQHMSLSPSAFYHDHRLARARHLARSTAMTVAEIAAATGFTNACHFSRRYRRRFGVKPSQDRLV